MVSKNTAIYRVALPRERLQRLPKEERALFFLLGHASNQIALMQKLVLFSSNRTPEDAVEQRLSGAQTQMLARMAVGTLSEAWELIHKRFLGSQIGKEYRPLLDKGGQDALEQLNRHFGASNLLSKVRSNFAFHHPYDADVEAAFQEAAIDPEWNDNWTLFMANSTLNWFYFASDIVILHGIKRATGEATLVEAQTKLMAEVRLVADAMVEFIGAFLTAMWMRHFGQEFEATICADIADAPDLGTPWIPFFIRVS
jgi:hypothetical protein